jgi:hypothetical protein
MGGFNNHGGYLIRSIETINFDPGVQHSVEPVAAAEDDADDWSVAPVRSERPIIDS